MEQEKFEMQRKHTENIQELLDDTNRRLAKMESEHNTRSQANVRIIKDMFNEAIEYYKVLNVRTTVCTVHWGVRVLLKISSNFASLVTFNSLRL